MSKQKPVETNEVIGYIKPTKTFRYPKGLRPLLATITDPHARGEYRKQMVQAVLLGNRQPEKKKKNSGALVEVAV